MYPLPSCCSARRRQSVLLQTIASQKYPATRLPEERTHLLSSHEKARISRECSEDFLKTWKNFSREIFQSEDFNNKQNCPKIDTYIKKKISLSLTFQIHSSSPHAQAFYRFFFVVVSQKAGRDCWKNRSMIFLTSRAVTSRYCFEP